MKYRSQKAVCGQGHVHDSKKEARRCGDLHLLQLAGEISGLRIQVKYEIIPQRLVPTGEVYKKGSKKGETKFRVDETAAHYIADFVYQEGDKTIIEDTKGFKTPEYILKRKLMKQIYCDDKTEFRET